MSLSELPIKTRAVKTLLSTLKVNVESHLSGCAITGSCLTQPLSEKNILSWLVGALSQ